MQIESAMHFPDWMHIAGCTWNFNTRSITLYVIGKNLPEVEEGFVVTTIYPVVSRIDNPDGSPSFSWKIEETHNKKEDLS